MASARTWPIFPPASRNSPLCNKSTPLCAYPPKGAPGSSAKVFEYHQPGRVGAVEGPDHAHTPLGRFENHQSGGVGAVEGPDHAHTRLGRFENHQPGGVGPVREPNV